MIWKPIHPRFQEHMLGYFPDFLNENDPRPAKAQINEAYAHGGGWNKFNGFRLLENGDILYPGDPPTRLLAEAKFRNETLRFYEHSWFMIVQEDGSWEIARLD